MIWQRLTNWAGKSPDQEAVVSPSRRMTYHELVVATEALSNLLVREGIQPGNHVALFLPNGTGLGVAFFAIARCGGVAVPLNVNYQGEELTYYLQHSQACVVITDSSGVSHLQPIVDRLESRLRILVLEKEKTVSPSATRVPKNFRPLQQLPAAVSPDSPVLYQYSTGSTGQPKPVVRTEGQLMAEVEHFAHAVKVMPQDRILAVVPLFHAHGLGNCLLAALMNGATMVVPEAFNPREVLATLEKEKITIYPGVPFMFKLLNEVRLGSQQNLSKLRLAFSAGAALDPEISRNFQKRFGRYVRQLYGSTETGSVAINLDPDIKTTLESVGRAMAPVEMAIFDESGARLPSGETGEVGIRSPAMTHGYDGMPEATAASFRGGFFFPGDIGRLDEQGRLYITGRKTCFINVAGNKVDPAEVEQIISSHPKVKEAVVLGVNDPDSGQVVKAVIVPRNGCSEREIIEHCRGKMAEYKIPRIIEFRSEIPKSPLGKILSKYLQ